MAGHSHWAGIKHKKGLADQKRGQLFSKLANAITIASRQEPNPEFNPRLRTAIEKARQNNMPQTNIERAIKRASEADHNLKEMIIEAYGPAGTAPNNGRCPILIEAITDNKNRAIAEIKKILSEQDAKWAEPGSVKWAFEQIEGCWRMKFKQEIPNEARENLKNLVEKLEEHDDVQKVITNN